MSEPVFGLWRKSTRSENEGACVEIAWRKSSYSMNEGACVELGNFGAVRDSKNPAGPVLRLNLLALVSAAKAGLLDRCQ
jgi:Domain of unknown function (DUF397)